MPVSFTKAVVEDVALLTALGDDLVREFCRMAVASATAGMASKARYAAAAKQLNVPAKAVERAVEALAEIFLECAKRPASEKEFVASVEEAGFNKGALAKVLAEAYTANLQALRAFLGDLSFQLPHYVDLDWRLDVQVATRCVRQQVEPAFVLELRTQPTDASAPPDRLLLQSDYANLQNLVAELELAVKQAKTAHVNRVLRYV
jgi:hypothetical protein